MAKDFWIAQILKFSNIDHGVLKAQFLNESRDHCNILQINFKDREALQLVTTIGAGNCLRFGISDVVLMALITSDEIQWQEKMYKTYTPVDHTGSSIIDEEFRGFEVRRNFYSLNDIVSVKHRLLYESEDKINFETEDEDDYSDWSPSSK